MSRTRKHDGVVYPRKGSSISGFATKIAVAAQVFKKYSQMNLQMKHEALVKINRQASEMPQAAVGLCATLVQ